MSNSAGSMRRRDFLQWSGLGAPVLAAGLAGAAKHAKAAEGESGGEAFGLTVCPWTPENPRHDHAQIIPLRDGRLMLVWSEYYADRPSAVGATPYTQDLAGDEAPCRLSAKLSDDQGRTWSPKFIIQKNIGDQNVKHPNLIRLPSGEIALFFTMWQGGGEDRRILWKRSDDECESWSEPQQFSPPGGFYMLDAGRIFQHSRGRIILPVSWTPEIWSDREHVQAFCFYSDDGGRTWQQSANRMDAPGRGAMEPAIVERKDGSLLAVLRTGTGFLYQAESSDGGRTWSEAVSTGLPSPQAEPLLRRIPQTGDLLLVWNHAEPVSSHRPRNPLTAAISKDEGQNWGQFRNLVNRKGWDSAYPNVYFLKDEFILTYYHRSEAWNRGCQLDLKIFPVQWLYA